MVGDRLFNGPAIAASLLATAAFSCTLPSAAGAAEFKLSKGRQYELCRTFHENLKRFPELPEVTMDVPIHPDFADIFRKVEWEELDPLENERVLREAIVRFDDYGSEMSPEEQEAAWKAKKDKILSRAREGEIGLGRARFDINHDGKSETVYRYGFHQWPSPYPEPHMTYAWNYHVMPWDQEKASRQLRRYGRRPFDAFYYQGRTYLASPNGRYEINVIEPNDVSTGELALIYVCEFDPAG